MKRKKRSTRKKLINSLDKVFSLYIRRKTQIAYGKCPFCGGEIACCFHFVTRSNYLTRWDEHNAIGSCKGCNYRMEFNPHPFILWYIKKYGKEGYENIVARSRGIAKYSIKDLEGMKRLLEMKLEALETILE